MWLLRLHCCDIISAISSRGAAWAYAAPLFHHREEPVYDVTLPVKDVASVETSLKGYTAAELAADFKCDKCKRAGRVTRQQLFTRLAPYLMLSLTRCASWRWQRPIAGSAAWLIGFLTSDGPRQCSARTGTPCLRRRNSGRRSPSFPQVRVRRPHAAAEEDQLKHRHSDDLGHEAVHGPQASAPFCRRTQFYPYPFPQDRRHALGKLCEAHR